MKRREFIELNGSALAAAGLSAAGLQNVTSADEPAADSSAVGNPVLLDPDVNLISVAWRVHQLSNGMEAPCSRRSAVTPSFAACGLSPT